MKKNIVPSYFELCIKRGEATLWRNRRPKGAKYLVVIPGKEIMPAASRQIADQMFAKVPAVAPAQEPA